MHLTWFSWHLILRNDQCALKFEVWEQTCIEVWDTIHCSCFSMRYGFLTIGLWRLLSSQYSNSSEVQACSEKYPSQIISHGKPKKWPIKYEVCYLNQRIVICFSSPKCMIFCYLKIMSYIRVYLAAIKCRTFDLIHHERKKSWCRQIIFPSEIS